MAENPTSSHTTPTDHAIVVAVPEPSTQTHTPPPKQEHHHQKKTQMTTSSPKPMTKLPYITRVLSITTFILSIPIIAALIFLLFVGESNCEYLLKLKKLHYGIIIGLISLLILSNVALFLSMRSRLVMLGLILVMIPVIVMLILGLALLGAFKVESESMPGSPSQLKMMIFDSNNWYKIKSCIYDKNECQNLASKAIMMKSYDFTNIKLSTIEAGCCRPPVSCNMEYVNATFWVKEGGGQNSNSSQQYDSDCDSWTNDETILCYNCRSCKEGFRKSIQKKWIGVGGYLVAISVLLFVVHLLLFIVSMWDRNGGRSH